MSTNKLYGLVSSRDNVMRYVGQTIRTVEQRFKEHLRDAKNGGCAKALWMRKELADGYEITPVTIYETCEKDHAERGWIDKFGEVSHPIVNTVNNPQVIKKKLPKKPNKLGDTFDEVRDEINKIYAPLNKHLRWIDAQYPGDEYDRYERIIVDCRKAQIKKFGHYGPYEDEKSLFDLLTFNGAPADVVIDFIFL